MKLEIGEELASLIWWIFVLAAIVAISIWGK
jgi:hypothetical protein